MKLLLGTRASALALAQSGAVARLLAERTGVEIELVKITTTGDRVTDRPLDQVGTKGLFTKEIEEALLDGRVDLAVHSLKDLPTASPDGLVVAAIPERASPWDAIVGAKWADLKPGDRVGTGSVRRVSQIRRLRPDLVLEGIRGNVDTRLRKVREGQFRAVVLAEAGLRRLGFEPTEVLHELIPAPGQGALAIQIRRGDRNAAAVAESVHDPLTARAVAAERAFLEALSGGCSVPAGAHARLDGNEIELRACLDLDGDFREVTLRADHLHAVVLGREAARQLRARSNDSA